MSDRNRGSSPHSKVEMEKIGWNGAVKAYPVHVFDLSSSHQPPTHPDRHLAVPSIYIRHISLQVLFCPEQQSVQSPKSPKWPSNCNAPKIIKHFFALNNFISDFKGRRICVWHAKGKIIKRNRRAGPPLVVIIPRSSLLIIKYSRAHYFEHKEITNWEPRA